MGEEGGVANEYSCSQGAQINYGNLTPYLTYHCKEIPIYVFPEKEMRGPSPNFHIHVSVSDLSISTDRYTYFPGADNKPMVGI
jgi:hypothetical protein